jgi:ketosteroid isomerase-like protein
MTGSGRYGNPGNRSTEVDLVRAIYEAFDRRDRDAFERLLAPDIVMHLEGTARQIGRAGPYKGYDGVHEYFADVDRVWETLRLHADDVRAVAGSVVVFGHVTGRRQGEDVTRRVVWTWLLRHGRALSVRADDLGPG